MIYFAQKNTLNVWCRKMNSVIIITFWTRLFVDKLLCSQLFIFVYQQKITDTKLMLGIWMRDDWLWFGIPNESIAQSLTVLLMQGAQGFSGTKGDKVSFWNMSLFVFIWLLIVAVMESCVLQGERGVGLAGPAGRVGPPGLKVHCRYFLNHLRF